MALSDSGFLASIKAKAAANKGVSAVLAAVVVIVALMLLGGGGGSLQDEAAKRFVSTFSNTFATLELADESQKALLVPLQAYADRIGSGEVGAPEVAGTVEEILKSPFTTGVLLAAIESRYVDRSKLSDKNKQDAKVLLANYYTCFKAGKIKSEQVLAVEKMVQAGDAGGLKPALLPEDLTKCLDLLRSQVGKTETSVKPLVAMLVEDVKGIVGK
jgi:hypothetical protein